MLKVFKEGWLGEVSREGNLVTRTISLTLSLCPFLPASLSVSVSLRQEVRALYSVSVVNAVFPAELMAKGS